MDGIDAEFQKQQKEHRKIDILHDTVQRSAVQKPILEYKQ
jgi:hypothetical protein